MCSVNKIFGGAGAGSGLGGLLTGAIAQGQQAKGKVKSPLMQAINRKLALRKGPPGGGAAGAALTQPGGSAPLLGG